MPTFQNIDLGDVTLRAVIEGEGPLVILVHGFPESWYSWRHQIAPLAHAGYRVCALDVRGYGGSSKPQAVANYDMRHMVSDVIRVADTLSPDRSVVLIGHDWGAPIVWNTTLAHPERVAGVAALSVPHFGTPQQSMSKTIFETATSKGIFHYQHYFSDEGVAEAELEADPAASIRRFYYGLSGESSNGWPRDKKVGDNLLHRMPEPDELPPWLSPADVEYYAAEFRSSGFRGPINRYRNHDRDFDYQSGLPSGVVQPPALFIGGDRDPVVNGASEAQLRASMAAAVPHLVDLQILAGCGHWTQQERPEEVNASLIAFLTSPEVSRRLA